MTCAKCGHPIEMTSVGRYGTRDHMQRGCHHRPAPSAEQNTSARTSARPAQRPAPRVEGQRGAG